MRVLQVINWLEYGGAERLVYNFVRHSQKEYPDIEMEVCTLMKTGILGKRLREEGFRVHDLNAGKWDFLRNVSGLHSLIKREKYDVVHAHLFPTCYWTSMEHFISRRQVSIYTEHNTWNRRRGQPMLRPVESLIYRGFDIIVTNSEESKEALLSWLPGLKNRVRVVENGVPVPEVHKTDLKLSEPISLLFVGRLAPQKGIEIAFDAVRILKNRGFSLKLTVVGEGPEREKLEANAGDLPVRFVGGQDEPEKYMEQCDILLIPSRWEGFGLIAVEGQFVGIPVIASRIDALSRVVIDGVTGLHFNPGDAGDLAEKIKTLLDDDNLRQKLTERGREEACQKWTITRYSKELKDLYQALHSEKVG